MVASPLCPQAFVSKDGHNQEHVEIDKMKMKWKSTKIDNNTTKQWRVTKARAQDLSLQFVG
jgi:hypothetical protein